MHIASGLNNRCVDRAISTCRVVLGIDSKLPVEIPFPRNIQTITRYIGRCFPNRDVFVWCQTELLSRYIDDNVCYCGAEFEYDFNDSKYIFMYAFIDEKTKNGHMVVGLPAFNYANPVSIVIAIQ